MTTTLQCRGLRDRSKQDHHLSALQLTYSSWVGTAVFLWTTSIKIGLMPSGPIIHPLWEWATLVLAGSAALVAVQQKWQARREREEARRFKLLRAENPLSLVEVLRRYSVRELGGTFLYLPKPERPQDRDAFAWLHLLEVEGLLGRRSWLIKTDHVAQAIRDSHPDLFEHGPSHFEVYKLDRRVTARGIDGGIDLSIF